ncbi:MAG: hypothetical protein MN733_10955, partial [Nitrososphaera sp.]|nr:hypothetical protein [Nitrososphaera sp.]
IRVLKGTLGTDEEELIYSNLGVGGMEKKELLSIDVARPMYIRAEVTTRASDSYDRESHFALTNPVWCNPS